MRDKGGNTDGEAGWLNQREHIKRYSLSTSRIKKRVPTSAVITYAVFWISTYKFSYLIYLFCSYVCEGFLCDIGSGDFSISTSCTAALRYSKDDICDDDICFRLQLIFYSSNRVAFFGEDPNYHNRICGLQVNYSYFSFKHICLNSLYFKTYVFVKTCAPLHIL